MAGPTQGREPSFSIVIPTRDRAGPLAECLTALAAQAFPSEQFEVVIVDDGGNVELEDVAARFRDRLAIALLSQPRGGPAAARNRGAAHAGGEQLAFTDDDCAPDSGWLRALAAQMRAAPAAAVGGKTVNGLPANPYAAASQLIVDVGYDYFNPGAQSASFFAANNLALPAERFRELGGFDASLATYEDRDLCNRWCDRGWPMVYAPDALVLHRPALDLRAFWLQHYRYGRGAWSFHRARSRRGSDRLRPDRLRPDPRFYWRLFRRALGESGVRRIELLALLVLAQGANAAGFIRQGMGAR